ncbi:class I SAM-dependent methyltransferase [Nocardia bovistercoris]|uniref:Methyltransferase domain-containing protein n=1 Tax=Nocardia bovistercoris TaxID=2785916 RepID=A0A931I7G4_9NOCA|nr:class I SAM-dependent methyltransferase [Nocardia bovistercoris]MBH0775157.1 methyltransferase domain-containing protein [Nocardia bovistercoris]
MSTSTTRPLNDLVTRGWGTLSRTYDLPLVQRLSYRPPHDEILEQVRTSGARRVADVGCGTGILAARIGDEIGPDLVYGCDPSTGMLTRACARSRRVRWFERGAEDLRLPDGALDAIVSTHAFHFFDHRAALREFHRVLAPGGLLAIVFNNFPGALARALQPRALRDIAYFPAPAEFAEMVTAAGFSVTVQRPVRRPIPAALVPDVLTVARRS